MTFPRQWALALAASVACIAVFGAGEDPAETLKRFRAPAKECREAVKGFLWLEAEEFSDYGGWVIDTQFVHKMGSAYLITKGVLKPLSPAKTEVTIPSPGKWRAWVRTKDWLPEYSPGKFALEVGGKRSGALGVSKKAGWRWEKAGDFSLSVGRMTVALVDLSGGFARCDAVLLTTDLGYVPPEDGEALAAERRRLSGADPKITDGGEYDVVVVGAGPGGLGASIAAARHGMKTLLVHDRPVLGGNNSIEQHTSIGGSGNNFKDGVADSREGGILEEARLLRRSKKCSESATYRMMVDAEPLITEKSNERVLAAERKGDRIVSVTANSTLTGGRVRYRGKVFIDGTGDGWLGYFVGASRMFGREAKGEFGEKDAPDKADTLTMSGCIDDYVYHSTGKEEPFEVPEWAHILPEGFNRPDVNGIQARWWLEHPGTFDDLDDPERARDELIRIHLDYWGWLRKHPTFGAKARTCRLDEIKMHNGRREGWRFIGDYVLTSTDCREGRRFPDAITCGGWALDLHDPMGVMNPKGNGWWSVDQTRIYTIPYRCIYSKDIANLYMAGRNISITHAALGSTRIMGTIFTIGQATGTAAAIAVRENLTVREVGKKRIKELQQALLKDDQFIPGVKNEDPLDLARSAKVKATSTMRRIVYDADDMDFIGVNSCWSFVESLWLELAACFPRGGVEGINEVNCYMRNRNGTAQSLVMDVMESDDIAVDNATRTPLGTMTATIEPKGGSAQFVRFAASAPLKPTKKYVWMKARICRGVDWFRRIHVYPEGGCMAYVRDGGRFDIRKFYQLAFYTKPALTGSVDARPEYVIDGFSRPEIYAAEDGPCTHAWRSDPAKPFPQAIRLDFPKPVTASEVRIVFDSGLTFGGIMWPQPKMLVKDYSVWGLVDGKWRKLAEVKDNMKRLQVHRFDAAKVSAINVKVDATWGAKSAHIQEIRVYEGAKKKVKGEPTPLPKATFDSVAYGSHPMQKMDVWLPEKGAPTPAIIFVHGGGFRNGDRKDPRLGERIPKCKAKRVALISVEYRLLKDAGDVKPPVRVCMDDVIAAIRFVRSKAKEWNIDLSRVGLTGSSAGAHAVLYASLTGDNEFGIRAVYTQYPQTSIDPKEMREWIPNSNYGAHMFGYPDFQTWLDHRADVLPWIEKYSPAGLLRRCTPSRAPAFVHDGPAAPKPGELAKDPTHSGTFRVKFSEICAARGISCRYGHHDDFLAILTEGQDKKGAKSK